VMSRRPYRPDRAREREEYVLTPAGLELRSVLGALTQWGDRNRPAESGPAAHYEEAATGEPVTLTFLTADGRRLAPDEVVMVRNVHPQGVEAQHAEGVR
jgi:hypothetical protein